MIYVIKYQNVDKLNQSFCKISKHECQLPIDLDIVNTM